MSSKNKLVVPEAKQALDMMKMEIAHEIGYPAYSNMPSEMYPALVNGLVVKEMVRQGEQMLINNYGAQTNQHYSKKDINLNNLQN